MSDTQTASPALSVLIPSYLEEENLRILLPRLKRVLEHAVPSFEIVILDTQEPLDGTNLVCADEGVRYVNRAGSNSFGSAVRTAIAEARGAYALFMDADGSHTPEFIPRLLEHRESYDVVVASRYITGGHTENNRALILMSRSLNWTYSKVLNIPCQDVSNSFKIYHLDQLRTIELHCDHFDIVEEILVKLNRQKRLRIKEVPFTFKKRMFGDSKRNLFLFILSYLYTLLRLRFGS